MRRKGTNQELAKQRKRGLALLKSGKKPKAVAEILNVTPHTICRWRREAQKPRQKKALRPLGRPSKLSVQQLKKLEKVLDKGAYASGYASDYWTLDRITHLIWQLFQVRYHPSAVWHVLTRMGWSSQRPQRRALHRNEAAIAVWKKDVLPAIKKSA
jgi:transposase